MKKLKLKKKGKLKLKKKTETNSNEDYFNTLDRNIELSEERNKKLGKVETGRWYHYKERFPPNDFNIYVLQGSKDSVHCMQGNISAVALQHYISDLLVFNRKPLYTEYWMIIKLP